MFYLSPKKVKFSKRICDNFQDMIIFFGKNNLTTIELSYMWIINDKDNVI